MKARDPHLRALLDAELTDPFAYLGMHAAPEGAVVRCFLPWAASVAVIEAAGGTVLGELSREHPDGLFSGLLRIPGPVPYRLRAATGQGSVEIDDPYRFPPVLGELDRYLLAEGTHLEAYAKLGAHPLTLEGIPGVGFAVWAPNARSVSVVGRFNEWDGRRHPMRLHPSCGVWDLFIPRLEAGQPYKFEIHGPAGERLPLKADPMAEQAEMRPATASVVPAISRHAWTDGAWMERREARNAREAPISIYEAHLGSWRRRADGGFLTYRELAETLIPYVVELGFTHLELLPITEHPFDGSWGYQPIGLFAPTSRFGTPDDFRFFVDACHRSGLALWIDWVPSHFPTDEHGLARFDGTHLYEHADPRQGFQRDWNTLVFNFGRREVVDYLINSALAWLKGFHVDGLRFDAVASILYLDYSRRPGEWIPNRFGGHENLEAVEFLRRVNALVFSEAPGATTAAEESTAWPMVSRPVYLGGLGFGYKWNMGWMHDTLEYMALDPLYRKYHHNALTFGLLYAFSENFILPLSHDEVVHGKRSLLGRMPGDRWQQFANLRAYYGFMWGHPGKKLLFMGGEWGQWREWNEGAGLDWDLLGDPLHRGVRDLVRDLNRAYRAFPALHALDCEAGGFEWVVGNDTTQSIIAFLRQGRGPGERALVVCNFTPVPREGYRVGVPLAGPWLERINTDGGVYGGSNLGNRGRVDTTALPSHGHPQSLVLTLPPLATLILTAQRIFLVAAAILGMAAGASRARAQIDPVPRNLVEVGYDQAVTGHGPQAGYAYYYFNRPDFFNPDTALRMAIAPAYLDSEVGFKHLLSPTTDVGLGLAGGAFGDNFYDVAQGQYDETQSFYGSGGGSTVSIYQLVNPGMKIPLNLLVRGGFHYSTYFDSAETAPDFKLPHDQFQAFTLMGIRLAGNQPLLFPALGLELSGWYERQRHFDPGSYGFDGDRSVSPATDLYWLYAEVAYEFKPSGVRFSFALTAGGSTHADLFSAWRLGGELPLVSEFPLMLPGYYYEELTAVRFLHSYGAFSVPLGTRQRWDLRLEAATARLDYLPGYAQRSDWQTGAGAGITFTPTPRYKIILRAGYGFNAIRDGKEGAESVGLLFQWDLGKKKPRDVPAPRGEPAS